MGIRICTESSSSSSFENEKVIDSTIYRVLSVRSNMATLSYPDRVRTEFDRFIEAASAKTAGTSYNPAFDSLDEYMGTIGVTNGWIC